MDEHDRSSTDTTAAPDPVQSLDPAPSPSREPDVEMLERVEGELADVEAVLPRIDDGTYGTCEACGAVIADELLAEAPATRVCAAHSG